jgi:bifunctional non-homologous end joining protein LigD
MPKKQLPQFIAPMMTSTVKKPFNDPDWIFETKLDGYRAIAVIDSTGVRLGSGPVTVCRLN